MNLEYKNVLYFDLETHEYTFKIHEDLCEYVGGVSVAYKLFLDNIADNPIILTTGPLSGFYPYISKSCLLYADNTDIIEKYGGGVTAAKMNMGDVDAIVFTGSTDKYLHLGISGQDVAITEEDDLAFKNRNADFSLTSKVGFSQGYFSFGSIRDLEERLTGGISFNIDTTESLNLKHHNDYDAKYKELLESYHDLTVEPRNNPSCMGCPMGCDLSHEGEDDSNVAILPRSLISCAYAESLYKNIPTIYACLSRIGYNYKHSELENLPTLAGSVKVEISKRMQNDSIS